MKFLSSRTTSRLRRSGSGLSSRSASCVRGFVEASRTRLWMDASVVLAVLAVVIGCDRADTGKSKDSSAPGVSQLHETRDSVLAQLVNEQQSEVVFQRALELYSEMSELEGTDLLNLIVLDNIGNWIGEKAFSVLTETDVGEDPSQIRRLKTFYGSYVDAAPNSELAVKAVQLSVSYTRADEDTDRALALTREIRESYPGSLAFYAALTLEGDLLSDMGNIPAALNAYLQVYLECKHFAGTARLRRSLAYAFEQLGMRWEAAVFRERPYPPEIAFEVARFYYDNLTLLRESRDPEASAWRSLWEARGDRSILLNLRTKHRGSLLGLYATLFRVDGFLAERNAPAVVEEIQNFVADCDNVVSLSDAAQSIPEEEAYDATRILLEKLVWHLSLPGQERVWKTAAVRDSALALATLASRICEGRAASQDETWRDRLTESVMVRARIWEAMGTYDKAIEEYQRATEHFDSEPVAYDAQMRIADIMAEHWGVLDSAIDRYLIIAEGNASPTIKEEAFCKALRYLVEQERFEDVCVKAASFVELFPESPKAAHVRTLQAAALLESDRPNEAITVLKDALATYPDSPAARRAHFLLGLAYADSECPDKAVEVLQDFVRGWPDAHGTNWAVRYLAQHTQ